MTIINCRQTLCTYHPQAVNLNEEQRKIAKQLCPICEDCGADQHIIDDFCVNCWNCMKDEGYIRKGSPKPILSISIANEIEQETEHNIEIVAGIDNNNRKTLIKNI